MEQWISLEPEAEEVCREASVSPLIFELPPEEGRAVLEERQSSPVSQFPATVDSLNVDTGKWGNVKVYVVYPDRLDIRANVIYYIHGAGWVFGSFHTHEKLVRELAKPIPASSRRSCSFNAIDRFKSFSYLSSTTHPGSSPPWPGSIMTTNVFRE